MVEPKKPNSFLHTLLLTAGNSYDFHWILSHKTKLPSEVNMNFAPGRIVSSMSAGYLVVIQKGMQTAPCYKAAG